MAIIANFLCAILYFVLAVVIDSIKQTNYKTSDMRQPTWYPRYLDADNDVVREAQMIAADNDQSNNYQVKVRDLNKVYSNGYPAVAGTTFGI